MAKAPAKATPQQARAAYERSRQSVINRVTDPDKRRKALAAFDSDPRIQNIRKIAGMPTVSTKRQDLKNSGPKPKWQQETEEIARLAKIGDAPRRRQAAVRETARLTIKQQKDANKDSIVPEFVRDVGAGLLGSANDALFGLPARAAAGVVGVDNDIMQEFADQQGQRAPVTNFLGTLAASIPTGGALLKGGAVLGSRLAASGAPAIAKTGRALQQGQRAMTIKRGQNVKNAGRLAAGGAAFGAATEAGKGRDVAEGAGAGAVGGVALGAGFKGGALLAGKASDVFRTTGANAFIRRYTTTTREALQQRADDFRRRTGTEPTFFELLSTRDRQSLSKQFGRLDEEELDRGVGLARDRVAAAPGEVAQVVRNATRGQRRQNVRNLATVQAEARGAPAPTTAEARLAVGAADNPTRLAQIRRDEGAAIMRPFDEEKAVDDVTDLIPTEMRALDPDKPGEISEVEIDPEMSAMIRSAAGLARIRPKGEGLTVRELTSMLRELKSIASDSRDAIQRGNAQRAADHLEGILTENVPGVEGALARMNENWAARSRQLEGMRETRMQADVDPSTSQRLRKSENVFETPEGGVGRAAAQRGDLIDDLQRRPDVALGTVRNLADDQTMQRQVAQNIGRPATNTISEAARAQSEGVQNLASAIRDPDFDLSSVTSGDLATVFAGFTPGSMVQTKGRAIATLWEKFGESISRNRSRTIVDMLFSRDPAMTQRAIDVLKGQGRQGTDALKDIIAMAGGGAAGTGMLEQGAPAAPTAPETPAEMPQEDIDPSQMSDEELMQFLAENEGEEAEEIDPSQMSDEELTRYLEENDVPYGQEVIQGLFPEAEITDTLRDPNSDLGRKNPGSYHVNTDGAVDIRPIPGVSFNEFVETLKAEGYNVVEAIDETKKSNRSRHATGPHWHVVIGE